MVFNWSIGGYLPFLSKVIRFACLIDLVSQHVFILASLAWLSDYLFTFSMIHSHLCLVKTLMVWHFYICCTWLLVAWQPFLLQVVVDLPFYLLSTCLIRCSFNTLQQFSSGSLLLIQLTFFSYFGDFGWGNYLASYYDPWKPRVRFRVFPFSF